MTAEARFPGIFQRTPAAAEPDSAGCDSSPDRVRPVTVTSPEFARMVAERRTRLLAVLADCLQGVRRVA